MEVCWPAGRRKLSFYFHIFEPNLSDIFNFQLKMRLFNQLADDKDGMD